MISYGNNTYDHIIEIGCFKIWWPRLKWFGILYWPVLELKRRCPYYPGCQPQACTRCWMHDK